MIDADTVLAPIAFLHEMNAGCGKQNKVVRRQSAEDAINYGDKGKLDSMQG